MKNKRIKLKASFLPYLGDLVNQYEKWGYTLIEVRPRSIWKDGIGFSEYIAIMEKYEKA